MAILANIIDVNPLTLLVVLVLALLILGPGKLPEVAGALGKSIREFRRTSSDLEDAIHLDPTVGPPVARSQSAGTDSSGGASSSPTAVDGTGTPLDAAGVDTDPQDRIRMLEARLAALEKDRAGTPSKTDS